ncbi:MAG: IS66 family transposase [Acidimicrobiales bacterium]
MGPGHRHLLERLAGLFESRCRAPLTSCQLHATSCPGVYENSGIGVRIRPERVYENLRNRHLDCHARRGRPAMDDLGVISSMTGIAIHDGWKPYRSYDVLHGLCNAHHLRELAAIGVVWDQGWANDLADLLVEAKKSAEAAHAEGRGHLDDTALHSIRVRYGILVAKGFAANPDPEFGKRRGCEKKAYNLLLRLDAQRADVLRFCADFRARFDNNQAERDIRMVKLQQKISGSWRTLDGARDFCAIRSYVSTLRKNQSDILGGLRLLFEGHAWLPGGT